MPQKEKNSSRHTHPTRPCWGLQGRPLPCGFCAGDPPPWGPLEPGWGTAGVTISDISAPGLTARRHGALTASLGKLHAARHGVLQARAPWHCGPSPPALHSTLHWSPLVARRGPSILEYNGVRWAVKPLLLPEHQGSPADKGAAVQPPSPAPPPTRAGQGPAGQLLVAPAEIW